MNTWKFVRSIVSGRRLLVLLLTLVLVAQATAPALAFPGPGGGGDPGGVVDDPSYQPPANGFSWAMEKRFGTDVNRDGKVDYHWIRDAYVSGVYVPGHYDPEYVYPSSWGITFNGCRTYNDYSISRVFPTPRYDYMYTWTKDDTVMATESCRPTFNFTDKATHTVSLSVEDVNTGVITTFPEQTVQVKDYFIVSIGDSYASGQGNPDIEQVVDPGFPAGWNMISPAEWQDERCMRSANAGPALAALALEASDPHSSVTFLSFACTGATIYTDSFDPIIADDEKGTFMWGNRGSGILGPYRGEITNVPYGDWDHYIDPQMQQVQDALAATNGQADRRNIDALIVSGGGNDMKFAAMIMMCVLFEFCWDSSYAQIKIDPTTETQSYNLFDTVTRTVGEWQGENPPQKTIPNAYAALGESIHSLDPKPRHVYVTQYPEPTINDRGVANEASETYEHHCRMLDDIFWPNPALAVNPYEAFTASHHAQEKLNKTIRNSVATLATTYTDIDWQFVDGLSVFDVDDNPAVAGKPGLFMGGPDGSPGHGYCASDNWIRRADESELIQGPVNDRRGSMGTMHPNLMGQHAIKTRILRYMVPDLTGQAEQTPTFTFSYTSAEGLTSQPGLNGWYVRSCDSGGNCSYPQVVGQAVADSSIPLVGASITVNDNPVCSTPGTLTGSFPGGSCAVSLSSTSRQATYAVNITTTGVYRFQFIAYDVNGRMSFLQKEIKVDLDDPVLTTPVGPFEVQAGGSVGLLAQAVPINDDMVMNFDWDLNNDGNFETEDEEPVFSAAEIAGPATVPVKVKVTDRAGRTATEPSEVHVLNTGSQVTIEGAPATSPEGQAINLTSTVTSALAAPYTYAWAVTKDGSEYASGTEAGFSFTPNDNGAYVISLAVTKDGASVGAASVTVDVTNVAPTVVINGAPASSLEGTAIFLTSQVTDPGSGDFVTFAWEVKKNGASYHTGSGASFTFIPNDNGVYEVSLQVTDDDSEVGTASVTVDVTNVAPVVAIIGAPVSSPEGTPINLTSQMSDAGAADSVTIFWEVKKNGTSYETGQAPAFSFIPNDNGSYVVSLRLTDDDGGVGTAEVQTITVNNVPPTVAISGAPTTGLEGTVISLTSQVSDDGAADTFTYAWAVEKDGSEYADGSEAAFSFNPNDNGVYVVSLQVTDKDGGSGIAASQTITVTNVPPTAAINGAPAISPEGKAISLTSTVSDPGAADTFIYAWIVKKDGTNYTSGSGAGYSFTPDDNGAYEVSLKVTDDDSGVATAASQTITVSNVPPVLDEVQYGPATVNEGGNVTVSGGIGDPGTKDTLTLAINWGDGSPIETKSLAAGTISFTASHTYADDNPTGTASDPNTITVKVTDKDGDSNSDTGRVIVANLAPSLVLSAPQNGTLYTVNAMVNVSASLTDPSSSDTLTCSINWGDGVTAAGNISAGTCTASHAYPAPGVYTIQVTGADDDLGSKTKTVMVVVYDPSAGFVTGGGWINSPAGAYKPDISLSDKATYGFVSKYQKGATVPTGNTAFKFEAGSFQFASSAYEWLVVNQAGKNAQFKGMGLINGAPDLNGQPYKFMLWAGDGTGASGADTFRIRIWWEDAAGEHDVYDNGTDQSIGGGSIVVHTK